MKENEVQKSNIHNFTPTLNLDRSFYMNYQEALSICSRDIKGILISHNNEIYIKIPDHDIILDKEFIKGIEDFIKINFKPTKFKLVFISNNFLNRYFNNKK